MQDKKTISDDYAVATSVVIVAIIAIISFYIISMTQVWLVLIAIPITILFLMHHFKNNYIITRGKLSG